VAYGGHEKVDLYDLATGRNVATLNGHTDEVSGLMFSPDGKALASGSWDGTAIIWDLPSRKERPGGPKGLKGSVGVAYSPDGGTLLVTSGEQKEITLCDGATGRKVASVEKPGRFWWAFSTDGKTLLILSAADGLARFYDLAALRAGK
jgi:WD40 repeat protein